MEEVKLAEVISRVVQAVLGDLIPVTQSYSMMDFVSGRSQKAAAQWCRRLEWVRHLIDCMDRCSQWPDEERPSPINGRVERVVGRIVIVLSAEGQLIALVDKARRM